MFFARLAYIASFFAGIVGVFEIQQAVGTQLAASYACGVSIGWGLMSFLLSFKKDNN